MAKVFDLDVRAARDDDIAALVDLVNSAYRGDPAKLGWTHEAALLDGQRVDHARLRAILEAPGSVVLVHEASASLRACVVLARTDDGASLGMLTVAPPEQAHGLGRLMLAAAEGYVAREWHGLAMEMTVLAQRIELLAWYERRGYARTGEVRPFDYAGSKSDVPLRGDLAFVVLRKVLEGG